MRNRTFELIENSDGHAAGATRMVFSDETQPYRATYSGPNVTFGHAIVEDGVMLYHARHADGSISAGQADVNLTEDQMVLNWRWLTGEETSGVSVWKLTS